MIEITDKKKCCGCTACAQVCPKNCISFNSDEEGFGYPEVDVSLCIDCHLCEDVCPCLNTFEEPVNKNTFVAINEDQEIRNQSSSGGVFTIIAEKIISQGGVVFGARFDENWKVVHDFSETVEGLASFRGSKYVQSDINSSYAKVKAFLREGRMVLFSGTPCQVSGLKLFLRKEYDNLLAVDFICHGVPSPMVWDRYRAEQLKEIYKKRKPIYELSLSGISFRDKTEGWKNYSYKLSFDSKDLKSYIELSSKNLFMRGFLKDLYLRPSCYDCPSKSGTSGADITIADFWGIQNVMPEIDDDRGCSLVIAYNDKSLEYITSERLIKREVEISDALRSNPSYYSSVKEPDRRKKFFKAINSNRNVIPTINKYTKQPLIKYLKNKIKRQIKKLTKR